MSENTTQKAVTLDALQAAAPLIATKAEVAKVKEQIQNIEAAGVKIGRASGRERVWYLV